MLPVNTPVIFPLIARGRIAYRQDIEAGIKKTVTAAGQQSGNDQNQAAIEEDQAGQSQSRQNHGIGNDAILAQAVGQPASKHSGQDRRPGISKVINGNEHDLPFTGKGRNKAIGCRQAKAEKG